MIVKVLFDTEPQQAVLFGSKPFTYSWYDTFLNFLNLYKHEECPVPIKAEVSGAEWVQDDKERYCLEEELPSLLEREGLGRKAVDINFDLELSSITNRLERTIDMLEHNRQEADVYE